MKLIKCKFSNSPVWDEPYMATQREYTFRSELELTPSSVVYGQKYKKFLHITEVINDDKLFYSANEDNFSNEKYNDTYFALAEMKTEGEMNTDYLVVTT